MLAVGVERDDGLGAARQGVPEPGPQGGALARVRHLADDGRARGLGVVAVSSLEPSSTTTTGRCRAAATTTGAIRGPSS